MDENSLDVPVRPLVAALNRTGWIHTVFSCAGHPEEPDSIQRGRRQAHVDVLVSDLDAWRQLASASKREAAEVVQQLGFRPARLRVAEGSVGPIPLWLQSVVGPASDHRELHYRRLVFEPVPYGLPAEVCRRALDAALEAVRLLVVKTNDVPGASLSCGPG